MVPARIHSLAPRARMATVLSRLREFAPVALRRRTVGVGGRVGVQGKTRYLTPAVRSEVGRERRATHGGRCATIPENLCPTSSPRSSDNLWFFVSPLGDGLAHVWQVPGPVTLAKGLNVMTALLESALSAPSLFDNLRHLDARGAAILSFDSRGHQYVSHDGLIYRLRFWSEEEWATLPIRSRPVACATTQTWAAGWAWRRHPSQQLSKWPRLFPASHHDRPGRPCCAGLVRLRGASPVLTPARGIAGCEVDRAVRRRLRPPISAQSSTALLEPLRRGHSCGDSRAGRSERRCGRHVRRQGVRNGPRSDGPALRRHGRLNGGPGRAIMADVVPQPDADPAVSSGRLLRGHPPTPRASHRNRPGSCNRFKPS